MRPLSQYVWTPPCYCTSFPFGGKARQVKQVFIFYFTSMADGGGGGFSSGASAARPMAPAPYGGSRQMSALIKKIQDVNQITDRKLDLGLPSIVVIGDQSSGKTSTLEVYLHILLLGEVARCKRSPAHRNLMSWTQNCHHSPYIFFYVSTTHI